MRARCSVVVAAVLLGAVPPRQAAARVIDVVPTDAPQVSWEKIEGAVAGDEVVIAPGTYSFRVFLEQQGTADQPIIIRAQDPGNRPVWDWPSPNTVVADWPGSSTRGDKGRSIWQVTGSYYQISGIVFRDGTDGGTGDSGGMRFIDSGPVTLRDCLFQYNDNGIQGAGTNILVESCEFDRNGLPNSSQGSHNLYIHGGTITVRTCYIHDARRGQNFHIRAEHAVLEYNWIARAYTYMGDMMSCTSQPCPAEQTLLLRSNVFIQGSPQNDGQIFVMYNDQDTAGLTFRFTMVNNTFIGSRRRRRFARARRCR